MSQRGGRGGKRGGGDVISNIIKEKEDVKVSKVSIKYDNVLE